MCLRLILLGIGVLLAACRAPSPDARAELHAVLEEAWAFELREDPLLATLTGRHEYADRLPVVTEEARTGRAQRRSEFLARLEQIDYAGLGAEDQISYAIFRRRLEHDLAEHQYRADLIPITADSGFHIGFSRLPFRVPLNTPGDYQNYISRLRAFSAYADQHINLMRKGLAAGMSLPQVVLKGYEETIQAHLTREPAQSVFYQPFQSFPTGVPETEQDHLRREGRTTIEDHVVPAYQSLLKFITEEYVPKARETIGASHLPDGGAYYDHLVRYFTTLDLTAQEVHQRGLDEVARIREEMMEVIKETGFKGDFAAFLKFLRADSRFYARTPEELLKEAAYIAKRMDGKLPSLFKKLPRLPYGVQPVPDHLAPKYTGGRYVVPALGTQEGGYYWVNTYNLGSRPFYVLESLTLHEAVPGHHLQISLAREMEDVPEFRRFADIAAFSEGWALYAERLGLEAGFYRDPYSNFGRLSYEMWRACRLVVDTGIHAFGWSREQAMEYLASNTALSLHEVRTETDRYISTPGQALAYKMGEMKIRELRQKAEATLKTRFDVREFHDTILLSGPMPLSLLEQKMEAYIRSKLQ